MMPEAWLRRPSAKAQRREEERRMDRARTVRTARRCASRLLLLLLLLLLLGSASGKLEGPRLVSSPLGEKRFSFGTSENHVVVYHEGNTSSILVGAANKLYYYDFDTSNNEIVPFYDNQTSSGCPKHDAKNYLTLVEKYEDKVLICGTNNCNPTCWFWVDGKREEGPNAQGLAPFGLDPNALVLIDGRDIYSTIKRYRNNGRIPRFRRIHGAAELYTSDTVMHKPQFVKAAVIKQEKAYNDKIYIFFREDNPESQANAAAPKRISRLAQLCKGDKGGSGSHSVAKWTTLLKSTLVCVDAATDRHFNHLQDVFIVESDHWNEAKIYGLFSNEWDYSAVCVYSVGDISETFRTSSLKGFRGHMPEIRPGQCQQDIHTPSDTYKVIDSHPELDQNLKQQALLFQGRHLYRQIGVHQVRAADGNTYRVLFLATDKGTIHKVAVLPTGATNILEIQPFHSSSHIQSMILDNTRNELLVASTSEVVQIPMAMCGAYKDTCETCVLARDPHCAWADGKCTSVYDLNQHKNRTAIQALKQDVPPDTCPSSSSSSSDHGGTCESCVNVTVPLQTRYYLNCSVESHRANYTWFRNRMRVGSCAPNHRHCVFFISSMTEDLYGCYTCVSQEDWFNQTLVTKCLMNPQETAVSLKQVVGNGVVGKSSASSCLGLLLMVATLMLIQ